MSKQIETPVFVDIHGTKPPHTADFGKAVSELDDAQTAQDARRNVRQAPAANATLSATVARACECY
jgi:hypothetical protein